jgi:hypothetical protein
MRMLHRYPLRPRPKLVFSILFFGLCAVALCYQASHTRRGVIIEGAIHLNRGQAQIFFWVLAALSLGFVALGTVGLVRLARGKLEVVIDDGGIALPGTLFRPRPHRFAWPEITGARLSKVSGQAFLTITAPGAKASLAKAHVTDAAFDEIVAIVGQRVPAPRTQLPVARLHS